MNKVLGIDAGVIAPEPSVSDVMEAPSISTASPVVDTPTEDGGSSMSSDEDDTLSYFAKLAKES